MTTQNSIAINEAQIRALVEDRVKAVRAKDINGVMSNHAPDILSFDVVNPLQYIRVVGKSKSGEELLVFEWPLSKQLSSKSSIILLL